jgi:hypothetical protein
MERKVMAVEQPNRMRTVEVKPHTSRTVKTSDHGMDAPVVLIDNDTNDRIYVSVRWTEK